ncbi:YbaN family protein [Clostridia bacterium]|nr:YbaN family protein [Clostridia bacterium]
MNTDSIKKIILILLGSIFLALGIIGVFIPILPTTPFLLLTSFCYLRSSERMYKWLINHRIFGAYIYSYITYKAIPKKTKIGTLIFLWSTLLVSMLLVPILHLRLFLLVVGIGVTIHLVMLKTLSTEDLKQLKALYPSKEKS